MPSTGSDLGTAGRPDAPGSTQAQAPSAAGATVGLKSSPAGGDQQRPKWKRMARKQLQSNAGQMKLKTLKQRLLTLAGSSSGSELEQSLMRTLSKSSQFDVQQTRVVLLN